MVIFFLHETIAIVGNSSAGLVPNVFGKLRNVISRRSCIELVINKYVWNLCIVNDQFLKSSC